MNVQRVLSVLVRIAAAPAVTEADVQQIVRSERYVPAIVIRRRLRILDYHILDQWAQRLAIVCAVKARHE